MTEAHPPMTIADLGNALRGFSRDTPLAIKVNGRFYSIDFIEPGYFTAGLRQNLTPDSGTYTVAIVAGEIAASGS